MLILCWLVGSVINDNLLPKSTLIVNKIMQLSGLFVTPPSEEDSSSPPEMASNCNENESNNETTPYKILTEPIMDASFLDDEINMVNDDEFSSWKLTVHNQRHDTSHPHPFGLYQQTTPTSINEISANNNTFTIDNSLFREGTLYSDYNYHGETIASITGSILEQLEFDDDFDDDNVQPLERSTSTDTTSSTRIFTPTEPQQAIKSTFSTDSLDKSALIDKLNRMNPLDNYMIAFQSSSSSSTHELTYKKILTQSCPSWAQNFSHQKSYNKDDKLNNNKKLAEIMTKTKQIQTSSEAEEKQQILICYPNYVLPDLNFLHQKNNFMLLPQKPKTSSASSPSRRHRPLSCNDVELLKKADFSHVKDWDSLNVLLPAEYRAVVSTETKPISEREKQDPYEKEIDENMNNGGVVMRRKLNKTDPHKRYSCNNEKKVNKFKRFSLQEIQEISEITSGISEVLKDFEGFDEGCGGGGGGEKLHYNTPCNKSEVGGEFCGGKVGFMGEKGELTTAITTAVTQLSNTPKKTTIYSNSTHGKMVLESLCPALYSLLSDGLAPFLETIFGRVPNTVWRVVEASIQCGPTAQSLNELVLRINSEHELMAEGPVKFNAFICGLLNLRSLTSWLTFLRTKDRLLRTHYSPEGLLYLCNTSTRSIYDQMLVNTLILSKLNYSLDIFHETKLLHQKMNKKPHPKYYKKPHHPTSSQMKRSFSDERPKKSDKSNLPKSKTQHFHKSSGKLDAMRRESQTEVTPDKFKKLQLQWELLSSTSSGDNVKKLTSPTSCTGSKIPRPISGNYSHCNVDNVDLQQVKGKVRPSSAFHVFNKK